MATSEASLPSENTAPSKAWLRRLLPMVLGAAIVAGVLVAYQSWAARRPLEWSGTIEARTISVGSRAGGRVKQVLVREGDRVEAHQPLLVLEAGDLEAQRLIAVGQTEQMRATLDKLLRGARPEEIEEARARAQTAVASLAEAKHGARSEQIAAAKARVVAAQAAVDRAVLEEGRSKQLFESGSVAKVEIDNAETTLRGAIAQRDAAQEEQNELTNGIRHEEIAQASTRAAEARASAQLVEAGPRAEDIRAAQAQVDAAQGRVDQVAVLIDELTIRATEKARVETLDLRPGDILAPNATAAVLLEDEQLYVRIYVPETQVGHAHLAAEVPVFVDSFPDRAFKGVIEHIGMRGEYSPRNLQTADERANQVFAVRVGLREPENDLRAGMAAFIRVAR